MSGGVAKNGHISAADGETVAEDRVNSFGVALSGGGIRATLFSLGVLIGLVESGKNADVTNIASVSGGSIANAAVAQTCEFATVATPEEFESVTGPVARALTSRGAFVFSRAGLFAFLRVVTAGLLQAIGPLAVAVIVVSGKSLSSIKLGDLPWLWIGLIGLGLLMIVLVVGRGTFQEAVYASTLASLNGGTRSKLSDLKRSATTHVVVATDLVSGAPVYFSREFVCCPPFGWGVPGKTHTATAVYSSAAFPIVFKPRRLRRKRFAFQNGMASPPFPRLLKLTDGGVYNNLGTDWFDELRLQRESEVWPFGGLDLEAEVGAVHRRIVVNAGAASRRMTRLVPFMGLKRTMNVLYDNTVRPRLQSMRQDAARDLDAPIVIDIAESPYDLARRLARIDPASYDKELQAEAQARHERAELLVKFLGRRDEMYWSEFVRQTASTPTKLTRAGVEPGARMMLHGYLSLLVVLHVADAILLPERLKDEGYFLALARDATSKRGSDAPTAETTGDGSSVTPPDVAAVTQPEMSGPQATGPQMPTAPISREESEAYPMRSW
jgi:predicted acylesterase/phospholipase RssA